MGLGSSAVLILSVAFSIIILALVLSGLYWIHLIYSFREKVKRVKPKLAFKILYINPITIFKMGFILIYDFITLGFFSEKGREEILDRFFNIKSIKKLKNKELNQDILKIEKFYKIYSYATLFAVALIVILAASMLYWDI